jgi:very-short-patch-repair endonuclease
MTSRVQTVLDCAVTLPLVEAVVVCDSALRSKQVTLEQLQRAVAQRLQGVAGIDRARQVLALCDPAAGSVLESVLRVRMGLAGITGFRTQAVLRTSPALIVEVDGARWHVDVDRDQARDNALAALGWRVLRFSWSQVVHEPEQVLDTLRAALAAEHPPSGTTAPDVRRAA